MSELQSISTDTLPVHRRLDYWHDVTNSALTRQHIIPANRRGFNGRMKWLDVDHLRLLELSASASRVTHTKEHAEQSGSPHYLVRLARRGQIASLHNGCETVLAPGDFVLYDTCRPYQMTFGAPAEVLIIRVPRPKLLPYIGRPESVVNIPMRGESGLAGLASRHLQELWAVAGHFLACGAQSRMMDMSLQLLASAYSALPKAKVDRSSVISAHRAQIIDLIERNLSDPELSPTRIADKIRMTPGYLHRVFATRSETVSQYILRRRLEESSKALRDPMQAGRSVTAIAYGLGFNSLPHFSRVFREHFQASPRDYRLG